MIKNFRKRLGSFGDATEIKNHPWLSDIDWNMLQNQKLIPPYIPQNSNWENNFERSFFDILPSDSVPV